MPSSEDGSEPWLTLWSALAHQGDVYTASFAAVPRVVHASACVHDKADHGPFQFPVWVEICRAKSQAEIPEDLRAAYLHSPDQLPSLVAPASSRAWNPEFLACALAAVAAAKGQPAVAEAVVELTPDVAG